MDQIAVETELDRYLAFCKNPLRDDTVVTEEFRQLISLPQVTGLGYLNEHTMLVATTAISLTDPDTDKVHDIGEFLIYLYRQRMHRIWETGFAFENVTRTRKGTNGVYDHPHISRRDIPTLGNLGILCIQRGHFHVYQHLRSGELHLATEMCLEILNTYDKGAPYLKLPKWPERGES